MLRWQWNNGEIDMMSRIVREAVIYMQSFIKLGEIDERIFKNSVRILIRIACDINV